MLLAIRDRRQQRSACRTYSVGIRGMSRMTRGGVLKRGNSFTDIEHKICVRADPIRCEMI